MDKVRLFYIWLKYFYWMHRILGLFPFRYNSRTNSFDWMWLEFGYSLCVYLSYCYFYIRCMLTITSLLQHKLVIFTFIYASTLTTTFMFSTQWILVNKLTCLLNECFDLMKETDSLFRIISTQQFLRIALLALLKTAFTDCTALIAIAIGCFALYTDRSMDVDYLAIYAIFFGYLLHKSIPNLFYAFVLWFSLNYQQMNFEIQKIIDESNLCMNNRKRIPHMQRLTKRLDRVTSLHGRMTIQAIKVNSMFGVQLLIVVGHYMILLLIYVRFQLQNSSFDHISMFFYF